MGESIRPPRASLIVGLEASPVRNTGKIQDVFLWRFPRQFLSARAQAYPMGPGPWAHGPRWITGTARVGGGMMDYSHHQGGLGMGKMD